MSDRYDEYAPYLYGERAEKGVGWVLAVCPSCGYSEVVDDGSEWGEHSLSEGWCGHNTQAFQRVEVKRA